MSYVEAGPRTARLAILGEAPTPSDLKEDSPFSGDVGRVLDRCLLTAGVDRQKAYITNVFDKPLKRDKKKENAWIGDTLVWKSSKGLTEEGLALTGPVIERLKACEANCIVALGPIALPLLYPEVKTAIGKWRGSVLSTPKLSGRKFLATYHPAAVLWDSTHLQHVISTDLDRAREQSAFPEIRRRPRELILNPSFESSLVFVEELRRMRRRTFFDLELFGGQLSAISFSNHPERAISIPFIGPNRMHRWTAREEAMILRTIAGLLGDPDVPKGNQNVTFDVHILADLYGMITRGVLDDPMVLHSLVFPDMEKGLAYQCSWLTDVPYYKDDGGKRAWQDPWRNLEAFWRYSALDAAVSLECFEALEREYLQPGSPYAKTYRETMELVEPLSYMMLRGLKADTTGLAAWRRDLVKKAKEAEAELEALQPGLNPASPKQMVELFYEKLGHRAYLNKGGKPTTDALALRRLARKGVKEAALVLRIRGLRKKIAGYADISLRKGRLHCSYNIRGAKTGRLSSAESEFEDGSNMQNLMSEFKQYLVSDEE